MGHRKGLGVGWKRRAVARPGRGTRGIHTACLIKYPAKLLYLTRRVPACDQNDADQEHNDSEDRREPEQQPERLWYWRVSEKFESNYS